MTDKVSAPNWQRLKLNDFGSTGDNGRGGHGLSQKPAAVTDNKAESELAQGFQKAYAEGQRTGHAAGFAAGEAAGAAEGRQAAQQLMAVATKLDNSLSGLDDEIAQEVLALALEIARQMLCQSIALKPDVVLAVVREALNQIPHQHAAIYLNPTDAALLRKHSGEQLGHEGHRIHEDSRLHPGDVVLEASGAQVDASLATRWRHIVEGLGNKTPWIDVEES